jgi:hypothetical protein
VDAIVVGPKRGITAPNIDTGAGGFVLMPSPYMTRWRRVQSLYCGNVGRTSYFQNNSSISGESSESV